MATGQDSAGHRYVEFDMSDDEQVRVTYVEHQEWADGPTLRIQKHAASGKVMQGPAFPASKAEELIIAIRNALP
jgi:hypothetical protein